MDVEILKNYTGEYELNSQAILKILLSDGQLKAQQHQGYHKINFDASSLSSGMYFYSLQ